MKRPITALALITGLSLSGGAQATLVDRGGGLIYDTDLNVTWLQDANYAAGTSYDNADGVSNGKLTWQSAVDWAANLSYYDSVRNVTYTDWRLPTTTDTGASGPQCTNSGTDCGYNSIGSEMAHLFYDELGNNGYYDAAGVGDQEGWGLVNEGPFINFQSGSYWSGTEVAPPMLNTAWGFDFRIGAQGFFTKPTAALYALAIRPGDVTAVPEASTYGMMLAGLGLVSAASRRKKQILI